MPTLYNQSSSNTRKAFFLIFLFLIFVILLGWALSYIFSEVWILYIAVIFSATTALSSYWNSDQIILQKTGAETIEKKDDPELYRVVENLSITAGIPMPKIFVLNEMQPNAFATGRDEKHAVIAVTRGLLQKLSKRELEGVIAHEMAHIKEKDILLGSVVVVLVGIVVLISDIFLRSMMFRSFSDNNNNQHPLLLLFSFIGIIMAPIAATMIKLAISRKQEFRADAEGSLLTRDPEGLAMALEKISQDDTPLRKLDNSTAHLYIAEPYKENEKTSWYNKLFMTHPPVEDRVRALRR